MKYLNLSKSSDKYNWKLTTIRSSDADLKPADQPESSFSSHFKGTLMQIWKSAYMFVFIEKYSPENFTFLILGILELYKRKVYEKFVYKHTETIESVKN